MIVEISPLIIQDPNYHFHINSGNRHFSINHYERVLPNGEVSTRHWLVYSATTEEDFRFCCKLLKSSNLKSNFSQEGINNWKHVSDYLKSHETYSNNFKSSKKWLLAESGIRNTSGIDSQSQQQLLSEEKRWRAVLGRLVAIVLFLSRNNLAFRGTSDKLMTKNNENFVGLVDLLGQFDSVMMDHFKIINNDIHNHYCGKIIQS
jgi:hypothetical protein